jgi:hypothetical protein
VVGPESFHNGNSSRLDFPELALGTNILRDIEMGRCRLLEHVFESLKHPCDSFIAGDALIRWLLSLGVDVEACINKELEQLPYNILRESWRDDKNIVSQPHNERGWSIGFEWVCDTEASDYLLMSEHRAFRSYRGLGARMAIPRLQLQASFRRKISYGVQVDRSFRPAHGRQSPQGARANRAEAGAK